MRWSEIDWKREVLTFTLRALCSSKESSSHYTAFKMRSLHVEPLPRPVFATLDEIKTNSQFIATIKYKQYYKLIGNNSCVDIVYKSYDLSTVNSSVK
jgi:hypothetical protein